VLHSFHQRCVSTALRLAQAHRGQHIALVAHGGVLDCLYRAASGLSLQTQRHWQMGNATINRVLCVDGGFTLVGWNDAAHLEMAPES
jgi:2,3-bisphosphoglycerate-dependent phosphoglycerate mutase